MRLLLSVCLLGCTSDLRRQVQDSSHRLQEATLSNVEHRRRISELENRLMLLEDRLETTRVAQVRTRVPSLPVVELQPPPMRQVTDLEPAAARSEQPALAPSEIAPEPIVFAGEAAQELTERPVLRMSGDTIDLSSSLATDERLTVADLPPPPRKTAPVAKKKSDPLALYRRAYDALNSRDYPRAAKLFTLFLRQYRSHDYADNAAYWLGECHYAQRNYPVALESFRSVVERYPDGNKVPDALLKISFSYAALGQSSSARTALTELVETYPQTPAAQLATKKLKEMER